ncbi:MAG: hypothetical protein SVR94_14445, partial [Pseudomonadota bacterium]|nr:hypothetical protein [Pseudomonadota bacterium]
NAAVREQDPQASTILTAVAVPTYLNYLLRLAPQIDYDFVGMACNMCSIYLLFFLWLTTMRRIYEMCSALFQGFTR